MRCDGTERGARGDGLWSFSLEADSIATVVRRPACCDRSELA